MPYSVEKYYLSTLYCYPFLLSCHPVPNYGCRTPDRLLNIVASFWLANISGLVATGEKK